MADRELERLRRIFLKAEADIINEIARLRAQGLIDYHAVGALRRVQSILRKLNDDCWTYVPRMVESYFYVKNPELYDNGFKSALEHFIGYSNALIMSSEQYDAVQRIVHSMMADVEAAEQTVRDNLADYVVGRRDMDVYRSEGLEISAELLATGMPQKMPDTMVERLRRDGLTAFVDKAGRKWSLSAYCTMVSRTTARQAQVLATLTKSPKVDLFQITSHGTTCKLCAPYEGRVYSKSGTSPYYPPLADAFGKIDKNGPNTLSNSYLNIHPNCLHAVVPFTEMGKTPEELEKIRRFSNPATNPYSRDPRSEAQIAEYRKKEDGRRKWMEAYHEWQDMRIALGDKIPKTFNTFLKHKMADDEKYAEWVTAYKTR